MTHKQDPENLRLVREARDYVRTGCGLESEHYNAALAVAFAVLDELDEKQEAVAVKTADIPEFKVTTPTALRLARACLQAGLVSSTTEGHRLVLSGAVKVDGVWVTDKDAALSPGRTYLVCVGKHRSAKVTVEKGEIDAPDSTSET